MGSTWLFSSGGLDGRSALPTKATVGLPLWRAGETEPRGEPSRSRNILSRDWVSVPRRVYAALRGLYVYGRVVVCGGRTFGHNADGMRPALCLENLETCQTTYDLSCEWLDSVGCVRNSDRNTVTHKQGFPGNVNPQPDHEQEVLSTRTTSTVLV